MNPGELRELGDMLIRLSELAETVSRKAARLAGVAHAEGWRAERDARGEEGQP